MIEFLPFFLDLPSLLLIEKILHQLVDNSSHYLQGFIHPRWLFGISSINSIIHMGVNPKIGGFYPQNGWLKIMVPNPINKWDDLGGFHTPIFGSTPKYSWYSSLEVRSSEAHELYDELQEGVNGVCVCAPYFHISMVSMSRAK